MASACSGGSSLTGGSASKKSDAGTTTAPASGSASGDSEFDQASVPAEVAGAFLTCGPATDAGDLGGKVPFGCVFRNGTTRAKLKETAAAPVASVMLASGATVAPELKAASAASAWHFHFGLSKQEAYDAVGMSLSATIGGVAAAKTTGRIDEAADSTAEDMAEAAVPTGPVYLFATSTTFAGNEIGGSRGGDDICQTLGEPTQKASRWRAMIFSSSVARLAFFTVVSTVKRLDETILANGYDDFWGSPALKAPVQDENGKDFPAKGDAMVWSGFSEGGVNGVKNTTAAPNETCIDWSTSSGQAITGTLNGDGLHGDDWLGNGVSPCSTPHHLYCISQ